ncbi:hypothetical protein M9Y10_014054 [Tritrichomonas musculus]|uniref:Cytoplasmic envelopment protein 3 n=1 Tax=Tritrichomonas musculus TaxID=1915356 RepID=A0ABR2KYI3_9EUKA
MGIFSSCCQKSSFPDKRDALRSGGRIQVERNDTEDPHAPLLTKKSNLSQLPNPDKDFDDFVENLSTDDGEIPDEAEIDEILNEKQD